MFKYNFFILSVVVLAIVFLTACQQSAPPFECTDAIGCVTIAPDEPLKLGALQDLSGGAATFGVEQINTIKLAVSERDNQFLGHPITLLDEDTQCLPEGGKVAAQKVVADPQVVAILGTICSGAAVPASKVVSEAGLVMVSGANSAPSLTKVDGEKGANWQPGYFRTMHSAVEMGQTAAIFTFQELDITRVATINDGDAYTKGLTNVFGQTFTELGGEIVLGAVVNKGETDMEPVLTAVADSGAELVFFPIFQPEGVPIVRQAREVTGLEEIRSVALYNRLWFHLRCGPGALECHRNGRHTRRGWYATYWPASLAGRSVHDHRF